jgi:5-(carboxyamino)imidazole ribonucleotide mutase
MTDTCNHRRTNPDVTIIMGSLSDRKVGERAVKIFEELGVTYQWRVASAHRTPELVEEIMRTCGSKVFIGIAGMAAHLPGVMASHTTRPIIAVPVSASFVGLDALLAAVQMPPGIPVATVTVDRGDNAALLAAEILALSDSGLADRLTAHREAMKVKVHSHDDELAP